MNSHIKALLQIYRKVSILSTFSYPLKLVLVLLLYLECPEHFLHGKGLQGLESFFLLLSLLCVYVFFLLPHLYTLKLLTQGPEGNRTTKKFCLASLR